MGSGFPDQAIVEVLAKKWGVSKDQVWKFVRMIDRISAVKSLEDRGKELVRSIVRYKKIYERAFHDGDYTTAMNAQDRIVRLLKLDQLALPGDEAEDQAKGQRPDPITARSRARLRHVLAQMGNLSAIQRLVPYNDTVEVPVLVNTPLPAEPDLDMPGLAPEPGPGPRSLFAPPDRPLHESVH
jgi:hypothetical protein